MTRLDPARGGHQLLYQQQVLDFIVGAALELPGGDLARLWARDEAAGMLRRVACEERGAGPPPGRLTGESPSARGWWRGS